MRVLLIDNYDSFTYNLVHQLSRLGAAVTVVRNDAVDLDGVRAHRADAIVLSPGPGHPANARDFGVCGAILAELAGVVPIFGVCLGHQGIVTGLGGEVGRHDEVVHGKPADIHHDGAGLFAGLPDPFVAMRYHSLVAKRARLPAGVRVSAWLEDGTIMALERPGLCVHGVQFHPESVGTPEGDRVVGNFLALAAAAKRGGGAPKEAA